MVDDDYELNERAAILEVDGGLHPKHALARAKLEIKLRAICDKCTDHKCSECKVYENFKKGK